MIDYEDYEIDEEQRFNFSLWKRLFGFTRPYRKEVLILCAAAIATAFADVALPKVMERLINDVAVDGNAESLIPYGAAHLALTLLLSLSVYVFIYMGGKIRTHLSHDIRRDGFNNLQRLPFSFYDHKAVGWLMARMTSDCERLSNILAWGVLDLMWGCTVMLGIAFVLMYTHFTLGLIVLSVIPLLLGVSLWFQKRILRSARRVRKVNSRITASYNEGICGVKTSKVFAREDHNLADHAELTTEMFQASVRNATLSALFLPIVVSLGSLATGFALAAGGVYAIGGLKIGTLIMFMTYTRHFFDPVQELAHWFAELQMAQASAERVLSLVETEPEIADSPEVLAAIEEYSQREPRPGVAIDGGPERIGRIEFRDVSFAYQGGQQVLQDFDLTVNAGETIALVGSTGGGKTTILSLLCRFYEPTSGAIHMDGIDYTRRSLHWLQSNLGIVLQTPHLFSGSIADNIRYGNLDATDAEVEAAAKLVDADEFILGLSEGYETQVGEGGVLLSTGQKQLVSFARAVLAEPQILVMDEATSSVDTETEVRIQKGLARVLEGRTSFVIAHRLSTIRAADRILVIENGRIAEQGSHEQLLQLRGRYHGLYTQQSLRDVVSDGDVWSGGLAPQGS